MGEPLYMDVVTALADAGITDKVVTGGRYGLGSKDTPPSSVFAVYEELAKAEPQERCSPSASTTTLPTCPCEEKPAPNTAAEGTTECKFWGLGGDGTVGANKNSIKIIGDHTDKYRTGLLPVRLQEDRRRNRFAICVSATSRSRSPYYINKADFVACHNPSYITKHFPIVRDVKPGGVFLHQLPVDSGRAEQASGSFREALHCQERRSALHHQRYRPRYRDRHGQAHQHHSAVCILRTGQGHARASRLSST